MQIYHNKGMLSIGPQVQAGRGRSHWRGNDSLHSMLMKAVFTECCQLGPCPLLSAAMLDRTLSAFILTADSRVADTFGRHLEN